MMVQRKLALAAVAVALGVAAACEPWQPDPRMLTFELRGAHQQLGCEGCHPPAESLTPDGSPAYTDEITVCGGVLQLGITDALTGCLDCHECDRKADASGHYAPRSCGELGCHSDADLTWVPGGGGTGTVTYPGPCAGACHGNTWDDNSPRDDSHFAHNQGTTLRTAAFDCEECHGDNPGFAGHEQDGLMVTFGTFTTEGGALTPSYSGGTCSGTYCHGNSLPEGGYLPTWNGGEAEAACGTCHGFPPASPHPDSEYCNTCHLPTGGENQVFSDKSTHLDGLLDL